VKPPDDPQLFRAAFETAGTGMGLATLDGRFLRVNTALCAIAARTEEELLGMTLRELTHPDDRVEAESERDQGEGGPGSQGEGSPGSHHERRWLRPDGSIVWVEVHDSPVREAAAEPLYILWQVTDITERRLMEERLRHLADHDGLTGLFNRRRFEEELERHVSQARRYGTPGALLLIDVDGLKAINDRGGHRAGDTALVAVARVLRGRLRQSDVIARFGGDEFAVLLPHASVADAAMVGEALAERIREGISTPAGPVTVSVGVGGLGNGVASADEALSRADASMYRSKARGGDSVDPEAAESSQTP
jgi:diguanylate cyclase (GGDEF)-like protein/PAS domain S-box-containing protein